MYSSNTDLFVYVSNLSSDIASDAAGTLNRNSGITVDFMAAFDIAAELVSPYLLKKTGDLVVVNILLYKGDHFILDKNIEKYSTALRLKFTIKQSKYFYIVIQNTLTFTAIIIK